MLTDRQRIECSIIPALLETHIKTIYKASGEKDLIELISISEKQFRSYFEKANKKNALYRRSDRICNKIIDYMNLHFRYGDSFHSTQAILVTVGWFVSLAESGWIDIEPDTEYCNLLETIGNQIPGAKDLDKIEIEPHILAIHELAQKEGYFC